MSRPILVAVLLFTVAAPALGAPPPAAAAKPPAAAVHEVVDEYFGKKVTDPYRWMEEGGREFDGWLKAQADHARAQLDAIADHKKWFERIHSLDLAEPKVPTAVRVGAQYFYLKTDPGGDSKKLCVRAMAGGAERVLVDPETLTKDDRHFAIDYFAPSPDGKHVAYGLSSGGSEQSVLHVFEVESGKLLGEAIDRTNFASVAWRHDGKSFFYMRLPPLVEGAPATDFYLRSRVYSHVLGGDAKKDVAVFGFGVAKSITLADSDFSDVAVVPGSNWAVAVVSHGVKNEQTLYAAPLDKVRGAATPWKKLVDVDDEVTGFDLHGDEIFLLSHKHSARSEVLRADLAHFDFARAKVAVQAGQRVVNRVAAAKDALYVLDLDGGLDKLRRLGWDGKLSDVALPVDGSAESLSTDPRDPGCLVAVDGWTRSQLWYAYDPDKRSFDDTHLQAPSPADFSAIESIEVKVPSTGGVLVPLSIIRKKGLAKDGKSPTVLEGYGAYAIPFTPYFAPTALAWLERGGTLAVAHVRGGGEYGEDWHQDGMLDKKQHTIDDFIACAEYLVKEKYSSTAHLGGRGTSAGGITIGGAITQRPELFAAALVRVGDTDALRSETMESGPANVPEFGSVKTQEGFEALWAMDAYQHVKAGTRYPAVLLTTGANDPRVAPWQAAKMAARLQAASTSGRPILLRVDYDSGHGQGSTVTQLDAEAADLDAFLWSNLK